ncbi:MAG: hypothetical protein ABF586_09225 [Sporolactobacillus sp.]
MSGVTIHGLSKETLLALSLRARHNKMSQQEYLRRLVILNLMQPEVAGLLAREEETLKLCAMVIRENTEAMSRLMNEAREGALR